MNMDQILAQGDALSTEEFIRAVRELRCDAQVWKELDRFPQYVRDLLYIAAFEDYAEGGRLDLLVELDQCEPTCQALQNCGEFQAMSILRRAKRLADAARKSGTDYDWEEMFRLNEEIGLYYNQNYDYFYDRMKSYAEEYRGKN